MTLPAVVLQTDWDGVLPPNAAMTVTAPGMATPLTVPLAPSSPLPRIRVGVWEWAGMSGDEGPDAAAWFSQYLGAAEGNRNIHVRMNDTRVDSYTHTRLRRLRRRYS